jgi:hypothetical protein
MFKETRKCSYFVISTLADFFSVLRNGVSVTLAAFLIIYGNTLHHRNPGKAAHSTNKKQGKSEKQILIDLTVLESGKWEF